MTKKTLFVTLNILFLALLVGSTSASITTITELNFIVNPSFEVAGDDPQTAAGWSGDQIPEAHTGSYCGQALAAILESSANIYTLVQTPQITLSANNIEIFTFWAKGVSEYDALRVYFGTSDGSVSQYFALTLEWVEYEIDLNALLVEQDISPTIAIEDIQFSTELNPEYEEPAKPYNVFAHIDDVFGGKIEVTVTREGIDLTYFYYALYVIIIAGFVVLFIVVAIAKRKQR